MADNFASTSDSVQLVLTGSEETEAEAESEEKETLLILLVFLFTLNCNAPCTSDSDSAASVNQPLDVLQAYNTWNSVKLCLFQSVFFSVFFQEWPVQFTS